MLLCVDVALMCYVCLLVDFNALYRLNDPQSDYKGANFLQGFGQPKLDAALFMPGYSRDFTMIVPAMGMFFLVVAVRVGCCVVPAMGTCSCFATCAHLLSLSRSNFPLFMCALNRFVSVLSFLCFFLFYFFPKPLFLFFVLMLLLNFKTKQAIAPIVTSSRTERRISSAISHLMRALFR